MHVTACFYFFGLPGQEGTKATGIDVVHFPVEVSHPMLGHPMAMAVFF